jgi:hypothetical protein
MKKCCKCSIEKPLTEFSKHKKTPDGLQYECKLCNKERIKQFHLKNPKYNKLYQEQNKEYFQKYRLDNSEHIKKYYQNWELNNSEKIKQDNANRYFNNPEKYKQITKKWRTAKQGIYEWYDGEICLYIGQSTQLNNRISIHKSLFKNSEVSKKNIQAELYEALRQHQNPQIRIIEECSPEILLEREQYYIDTKKPLYNRDNNESNKRGQN